MADDDRIETTPEQFAEFDAEVRRVWDLVGMTGWDLYVSHTELDADEAANCSSHGVARRITIRLNTKPNAKIDDVKRAARHEFCHAFLQPLGHYSSCRSVTSDELEAAEHEVVMRLMALLDRIQ